MDWIDEIETQAKEATGNLIIVKDQNRDVRINGFLLNARQNVLDLCVEVRRLRSELEAAKAHGAKIGKWPIHIPGDTFHGAKIIGADYENQTVTLEWGTNALPVEVRTDVHECLDCGKGETCSGYASFYKGPCTGWYPAKTIDHAEADGGGVNA